MRHVSHDQQRAGRAAAKPLNVEVVTWQHSVFTYNAKVSGNQSTLMSHRLFIF